MGWHSTLHLHSPASNTQPMSHQEWVYKQTRSDLQCHSWLVAHLALFDDYRTCCLHLNFCTLDLSLQQYSYPGDPSTLNNEHENLLSSPMLNPMSGYVQFKTCNYLRLQQTFGKQAMKSFFFFFFFFPKKFLANLRVVLTTSSTL